jgi:hypothetical protein
MSTTYSHHTPHSRQNTEYRVKTEPVSLAQLMRKAAQELKMLSAEVNLVEREIEEFNQFYYAEVGALYEKYKQLKLQNESAEEENEYLAITKIEKSDPVIAALSKKIFRRVAKICHPDSNEATGKAEFFVKLNDAYKAQDLGGLLLLEQHLHKNETKHYQEEQLEMMEQAKYVLDQRKIDLMNSPAYKLRQKIFWAKMGGQDLIAQIKRHLERQIAAVKFTA